MCLDIYVFMYTEILSSVAFCYTLQTVGCDNVLESGMEADACGICNGNNSIATLVSNSSSEVINYGKL